MLANDVRNKSVSHATFRPEDLIPKFLFELEELDKKAGARFNQELIGEGFGYSQCGVAFGPREEWPESFTDDDCQDLIERLTDALNRCAPKGYFFGSHPGNDSDYGFWPCPEE